MACPGIIIGYAGLFVKHLRLLSADPVGLARLGVSGVRKEIF